MYSGLLTAGFEHQCPYGRRFGQPRIDRIYATDARGHPGPARGAHNYEFAHTEQIDVTVYNNAYLSRSSLRCILRHTCRSNHPSDQCIPHCHYKGLFSAPTLCIRRQHLKIGLRNKIEHYNYLDRIRLVN